MKPRHVIMAVTVAMIWGFNFITIKLALKEVSPFTLGAMRFIIVAIPLVFFIKRPTVSWGVIVSIGLTLGFLKFALLFLGLYMGLPAGISSLVLQTQILFNMIFSYMFFKQKITWQEITGVFIALLGICLLGCTIQGHLTLIGFILLICSACSWGVANVLIKKTTHVNAMSLIVWMSLLPPIPFAICAYYIEGVKLSIDDVLNISALGWGAIIYIAWGATILGYGWWTKLVKIYSPTQVGIYGLLIPIFAIIFANIFFDEQLTIWHLISGIFILTGISISQGFFNKKNPPKNKKIHSLPPKQEEISLPLSKEQNYSVS